MKVTKAKIDRLFKNLLKLEEMTGRPLIPTRRYDAIMCPMLNFGPYTDRNGLTMGHGTETGVLYWRGDLAKYTYTEQFYKTHTEADSRWWASLTEHQCAYVNSAISKMIVRHLEES